MTSTVDDTVVFSATDPGIGVHSVPLAGGRPPSPLPNTKTTSGYFLPTAWSRDGARLCGVLVSDSGRASGVAVYDFKAQTITPIASDETFGIRWLPDGRRVIYFSQGQHPALVIVDSVTHQRSMVSVPLPAPPTNDVFSIAADGRTIYYGAVYEEADIWIAERRPRNNTEEH